MRNRTKTTALPSEKDALPVRRPSWNAGKAVKRADLKIRMLGPVESEPPERAGDLAFRVRRQMKEVLSKLP